MLKLVKNYEQKKRVSPITQDTKKYLNEINLSTDNISENSISTVKNKLSKLSKLRQAETKNVNELKDGWKDKPVHAKSPICASDTDVNSPLTHHWLFSLGLKSETEGFIIAAYDQSLPRRNFQANILENGADPQCRVCDKHTRPLTTLCLAVPF